MSTNAVERALASGVKEAGPLLLALPEDQWFERKSVKVAPKTLAAALVAFGNAEGGTIVVGLGNGSMEGRSANDPRAVWMVAG